MHVTERFALQECPRDFRVQYTPPPPHLKNRRLCSAPQNVQGPVQSDTNAAGPFVVTARVFQPKVTDETSDSAK